MATGKSWISLYWMDGEQYELVGLPGRSRTPGLWFREDFTWDVHPEDPYGGWCGQHGFDSFNRWEGSDAFSYRWDFRVWDRTGGPVVPWRMEREVAGALGGTWCLDLTSKVMLGVKDVGWLEYLDLLGGEEDGNNLQGIYDESLGGLNRRVLDWKTLDSEHPGHDEPGLWF